MIIQFMKKGDFMQLILLLLLLISGSKNFSEVRPLIEEMAGGDAARMLDEVESLTQLASAFNPPPQGGNQPFEESPGAQTSQDGAACAPDVFPLAPISNIADEGITYCLSRYISTGQ